MFPVAVAKFRRENYLFGKSLLERVVNLLLDVIIVNVNVNMNCQSRLCGDYVSLTLNCIINP